MKQIIAMGGGGFLMESENPLLDRYLLQQAGKESPNICYIGTASGDNESMIEKFYMFFSQQNCVPSHLSLFKPPVRDLESYILTKDIIYVGGGNTKNLLVLWKEWGLDKILYNALEKGVILAGISAGSICWFEEGVTDSYGDGLEPLKALGFIEGSNCPHYDGERKRRPTYRKLVDEGILRPGIAADDGVAVHYVDGEIKKIVSSRPGAKGYFVSPGNEKELETHYLGQTEIL